MYLLLYVSWRNGHHNFGRPVEVWWKDLYKEFDKNIPIKFLICHSVQCDVMFEQQTVYLVCIQNRL